MSERSPLMSAGKGANDANGHVRHEPPREYDSIIPPIPHHCRATEESRRRHHNIAGLTAWQFRLTCMALWSATFLSAFDSTVIATLLADIGSSFGAFHLASWLGTAYLLSLCCFTPIYGRLSDTLGRKNTQLIAVAVFTLGTALCAVAKDMYQLIGFRVLAGFGGGGLTSVGSILLSDLVDLRHRGLVQGMANILYGLGAALGGPVGGWMADRWGWRFAFTAQVPLLIGSFVLITLFVPGNVGQREEGPWLTLLAQIDYLGTALLGVSVGALLLGVSLKTAATKADGSEFAWTDRLILGLLLAFAVSLVLFLFVEGKYAAQPVLPLSMMVRRTPFFIGLANLLMAMAVFSMLYNVPLWFVAVKLQNSSNAGVHLLPYSVLIGFGSLGVGWYMRHTGRYWGIMVASGLIVFASCLMLLSWWVRSPDWILWVAQSPAGFGYAGVLTSTLVALMTDVQREGKGEM